MKNLFFIFAILSCSSAALAEPDLKKLILSDCGAALEQSQKLPEENRPELVEYLGRVLTLETPSQTEGPNALELRPHTGTLGGDDFLRSVRPTRELDAKVCAARIASLMAVQSLKLLPDLIRLQNDPLLSTDARIELHEAVRKIAAASARRAESPDEHQTLEETAHLLNPHTEFDVQSVLVEFRERSQSILLELLQSREGGVRSIVRHTLRLIDPSGAIASAMIAKLFDSSPDLARSSMLEFLGSFDSVSFISLELALRPDMNGELLPSGAVLIHHAGQSEIEALLRDPAGRAAISRFFTVAPLSNLREFVPLLCDKSRCDQILKEILKQKELPEDLRLRILTVLASTEVSDEELFQFARAEFSGAPLRKAIALEALGAFSAKKGETLELISPLLQDISTRKTSKSGNIGANRSLLIRSLARLVVRLSPIPGRFLQESFGEELLGLEITPEEPLLPAEAISSFRPVNSKVLLKALGSSSESVRKQGLAAIARIKPFEGEIIQKLLELAAQEEQPTVEMGARNVLATLGDQIIAQLDAKIAHPPKNVALVAAELLLKFRPANKIAAGKLNDAFPAADCVTKLRWYELLKPQSAARRPELWGCHGELLSSAENRDQYLKLLSPLSDEEWGTLMSALPADATLTDQYLESFLAAGAPPKLVAPPLLAKLQSPTSSQEILSALKLIRKLPAGDEEFVQPMKRLIESFQNDIALHAVATATLYHFDKEKGASALIDLLSDVTTAQLIAEVLPAEELQPIPQQAVQKDVKLNALWPLLCKVGTSAQELEPLFAKALVDRPNDAELVVGLICISPNSVQLPKSLHLLSLDQEWKRLYEAPLPAELTRVLKEQAQKSESFFERALYLELAQKLVRQ